MKAMKALHLEMIRVTEAAAIAASVWVGRGDKIAADQSATDAMKDRLNKIEFAGKIVIGEGRKDNAPGLFLGDRVGAWDSVYIDPDKDIAVDPLDGTSQTAKGGNEAMAVLAIGEKGSLLESEGWYMQKLAHGPAISNVYLAQPTSDIVRQAGKCLQKDVNKVTVCVLDRPRHAKLIQELRDVGCCIKLIQDCDVSAAIATAIPDSGIDLYMGVGGAPEGVIGAAALKCLNGEFQGIMCNKDGVPEGSKIYFTEELAVGDVTFCATGVTNGSLLKGVRWTPTGPITHSLLMRSGSGTVRWIEAHHGN
jgi:fructose-1,6-bisphosphatase class II